MFSTGFLSSCRRSISQSIRELGKTRGSLVSHGFCESSPSPSVSTASCSSTSSKIGLLGWYLSKLSSHPFITKSVTTSLIYAAADLTSQMITLPAADPFDLLRTSRMAAFGLIFLGPSQHLWFNFLSKALPRRDVQTTLKKILMGQAIYGPCNNSLFFSYNAALQGESGEEIMARLKRDLLPTLRNGLLCWPICDFITLKFVPVHLQPLTNSSFAYLWTIYLTYVASLRKTSAEL